MRLIRVDDEPEYGVALGSILVSLLEPEPGTAREFNRWYERDHFYAGCMSGQHFFSGRRFLATRDLKALRYPPSSEAVDDTAIGSFLALYWMERGHHVEAVIGRSSECSGSTKMDEWTAAGSGARFMRVSILTIGHSCEMRGVFRRKSLSIAAFRA